LVAARGRVGCGAYRFPIAEAAEVAVNAVSDFLRSDSTIEDVVFACFDPAVSEALQKALSQRIAAG
jgi:O-acetyl-ADP-ribose deacetylase (regulator of RNase III)